MRVLFISFEYVNAFSGNGVYAQTIVRGLEANGHQVRVLCAAGPDAASSAGPTAHFVVPVPTWGRLDRGSAFEAFAAGSAALSGEIAEHRPDLVCAVDWTGFMSYERLSEQVGPDFRKAPLCWFNFRIFFASHGIAGDDREFYREVEVRACTVAARAVALCRGDAARLQEAAGLPASRLRVLWPPLRHAVAAHARPNRPPSIMESRRHLILCCCRLSPEKHVENFVQLVCQAAHVLRARGLVPAVVGYAPDEGYAESVLAPLREAFPGDDCEVHGPMSTEALCGLMRRSLLLVHPPQYDAFGMVVLEGAACGAAPVVDNAGGVGAVDIVSPHAAPVGAGAGATSSSEAPGAIPVEMGGEAGAQLARLLESTDGMRTIRSVAAAAQQRALDWQEDAFARQLAACLAPE